MKIVYFIHCFFPEHFYGSETYTLNIAKYMQSMGHDVHVVTAKFPGEVGSGSFVEKYVYHGLDVLCFDKNVLPNTRVKDTYYQEEMRAPLKKVIQQLNPDVVHVVHLINHTSVLLEVLDGLEIPILATFTDFFGFCFNNKLQAVDGGLCSGPSISRKNCIACFLQATYEQKKPSVFQNLTSTSSWVSMVSYLTDSVCSCFPKLAPHKYREIIPDLKCRPDVLMACYQLYWAAIAPSKFLKDAYFQNGFKKNLYLQNFGVDIDRSPKPDRGDTPLRIGYIGQLAAHKGVDLLVDAFRNIKGAELHIYGSEDQNKDYSDKLRKLADICVSDVFFHGTFKSERMAAIMSELDFLVIPSTWYENSPLVLLYALATHTPAIVSDVEGMTEFVNHGENGYVFPMGSVSSLKGILATLSITPNEARKMNAKTNYARTTGDMAEDVLTLYREMIHNI